MATSAVVSAPPPGGVGAWLRRLRSGDEVARLITLAFACTILVVTVGLIYQLWTTSALPRHKFGFGFLTASQWNPVTGEFGALPFIYGTVVTSVIALLIAVPLGVGAAIFLAELAPPRISSTFTFFIELLAAVPSVIYGLLAFFTVVPLMRDYVEPFLQKTLGFLPIFSGTIFGFGYLTAGVILAIMTLPFIISISREALLEVPTEQREAALALGATRWESTWQAVVPYARLGIFGSVFLGLARALGETMAVTMVIGNDPKVHESLFALGYSIAAIIANEFSEATTDLQVQSLVLLGLVLFLLTIVINALARLLIIATARHGSS
ncbi:MAG TPA: phosphate ABC transporter permease subunit PstC [Bryobacteraceae bacterium]|jgi:phosphate transport system permease protein|nr:phosphate ABC transporter permease subunit PstC [Bryobacteraceae bacterium]